MSRLGLFFWPCLSWDDHELVGDGRKARFLRKPSLPVKSSPAPWLAWADPPTPVFVF
jgi:hypothetical protein